LRLLQENPELSQRELAEAVGISVGGVHYVLRALIDKGLIKLGNFSAADDKRRYAYVLTPKGLSKKASLTRAFLKRKIEEYNLLEAEILSLKKELRPERMPENVRAGMERTRSGRSLGGA
jgi:EPS-associated MarR family transcriptional regulator